MEGGFSTWDTEKENSSRRLEKRKCFVSFSAKLKIIIKLIRKCIGRERVCFLSRLILDCYLPAGYTGVLTHLTAWKVSINQTVNITLSHPSSSTAGNHWTCGASLHYQHHHLQTLPLLTQSQYLLIIFRWQSTVQNSTVRSSLVHFH